MVIYRTTHGESPLSGRSKCPHCGKIIGWKHNIPLVSFLMLKGRCANCRKSISWQYPIVEFLSGVLFVWWYFIGKSFFLLSGAPLSIIQPIFWLVVGMILLVVFITDFKYGIIPDSANLLLFSTALIYRVMLTYYGQMQLNDFINALISGGVLTLFFWSLWWMTNKKGFGFGDVKLAPGLGLVMGWPRVLVGVMAAFVIGAAVGLMLIGLKRKKFRQTIPFGPFLVIGTAIGLLWGGQIWNWYFSLI